MELNDFNTATPSEASELVRSCAHVDRWVEALVAGRPYASVDEVVEAALTLAHPWTDDEVDSALARHPRIGEKARGQAAEAQMSRQEQSGVATDAGTQARLAEGNAAYEAKFGHVFLIRAAGRSAEEILEQLQQRLTNTPDTERRIAAEQLREIAALRLRGALS
ncbi:2-oxo-4-hydroxy-4-carboxy-5-ureidoimidazoline decarboxylase [Ruania albidiflava]|uniref:2-oxo-4-hydroxy-4-carboxy-5-ureidoimidazoline decarboxylase n=1 Tax=Ruania albidiflava TaxID=366586 RepID=UPI0023F2E197|nr:2-oxo-4-hydroxy-4-carboxy-5-ureidoimidazoline decarboxylase [Ruania albidiflava]